jgi:uncharacterized protein involved in response to NO
LVLRSNHFHGSAIAVVPDRLSKRKTSVIVHDTSASHLRNHERLAVLRYGFRPFFLAAGVWSAACVGMWLAVMNGGLTLPSILDPVAWHTHEMLFGYAVAAVAGFLLTAIPNWTGRLPIRGSRLALLVGLWIIGRLAMASSAVIGPVVAAAADSAFLLVLWGAVLREILTGRNWRNLPVAALIGLLAGGNLLIHFEYLGLGRTAGLGLRLSIAALLFLIALIGGRIVPSFTRNWLKKRGEDVLPSPFSWPDRLALIATALAGLFWVFAPEALPTGVILLFAAVSNGLRLARWRGHSTLAEPLVWVLHLGYGWLAVGFALLALSLLSTALPHSAALHGPTSGAIGTMTLAVMTRATLGHTGRALTAGPSTTAIYLLATAASLLRVAAPLFGSVETAVVSLSGLLWIAAFTLFAAIYGPLLVGRPTQTG